MSPGTSPAASTSTAWPAAADPGARRRGIAKGLERPVAAVLGDHVGPDDRDSPARISRPSRTSPRATARTPATSSRTTNGSVAAPRTMLAIEARRAGSSALGPLASARLATSSKPRPDGPLHAEGAFDGVGRLRVGGIEGCVHVTGHRAHHHATA